MNYILIFSGIAATAALGVLFAAIIRIHPNSNRGRLILISIVLLIIAGLPYIPFRRKPTCIEIERIPSNTPPSFGKNFEEDAVNGFSLPDVGNWERKNVLWNGVFQATNLDPTRASDVRFSAPFSSGCIEFRFKIKSYVEGNSDSGNVDFHFGFTDEDFTGKSESFVFVFVRHSDHALLVYQPRTGEWTVYDKSGSLNFKTDKWYSVSIIVDKSQVKAYWDGNLLISSPYPRDNLKTDRFSITVGQNTIAQFDDIQVWNTEP
jgi:hypothetical protein